MAVAEQCPGQQRMPGRQVGAEGAAGAHSSAGLWAGGLSVPGWNALLRVPVNCFQCVVVLACWQQFRGEAACVACRWVWKQSCGSEQCYGTSGSFCVTGWSCQDNIVSPRGIKKDSEILGFIFFHQRIFLFVCLSRTGKQKAACLDYCECSWGKNEREGMSNNRGVLQRWEWRLSLVDTWWGCGSRKQEQMALKLFVFSLALWNLWLPPGLTIVLFFCKQL